MKQYPSIAQGFGILGIFLLATILCGVISILMEPVAGDEATFFVTYVLSVGGTFLTVNAIRKNKTGSENFQLAIPNERILLYVAAVAIAIPFGITAPLTSVIPMNDFVKTIVLKIAEYKGVWGFLAMVIAAPIFEELIFRGIILDGFLKRYTPLKSILVSSALFGIFHMNPWQFVTAMILGSFIGWVYYRTRSISVAIVIHMLNNLIAFISMQFTEMTMENIDETIIEYYGGILPFLSITLAALTVTAYGIYTLNNQMPNAPEIIPQPTNIVAENSPAENPL